MNRQSTEGFQESATTMDDTLMVDTCYTFIQTHRMYNTKSEP